MSPAQTLLEAKTQSNQPTNQAAVSVQGPLGGQTGRILWNLGLRPPAIPKGLNFGQLDLKMDTICEALFKILATPHFEGVEHNRRGFRAQ